MNSFTGNIIDSEFSNIFLGSTTGEILKITPEDAPYYYLRAEQLSLAKANPFPVGGFPDTNIIDICGGFYEVTEELLSKPDVNAEINFLKGLGLIVEKGGATYVYDLAEVFYGKQGLFMKNNGAAPAVLSVLYNYVLPGRFWTAYYTRSSLPDNVYPSTALEAHIKEIHELIMSLLK
jgi:hypothetical protein